MPTDCWRACQGVLCSQVRICAENDARVRVELTRRRERPVNSSDPLRPVRADTITHPRSDATPFQIARGRR
jgi:hypothetical protein